MSSISKRQRIDDRISNLPSNLITHILSFLSTKDAVRTSALSTHWNQQWTSITHLDFDDGFPITGMAYAPTIQASFVNFVYRVLLFKVTGLHLLRLKCGLDYGATRVNDWLCAALSRNVRHIDVTVPLFKRRSTRLDYLFSSRNLVVLKLGTNFLLRIPTVISLVSLKILHFNSVEFEDSESLSKLVSSCPVLEELKMQGTLCESIKVLNISSLVLKRLILKELYTLRVPDTGGVYSYDVVLNTPSLQYLEHDDNEGMPDKYKIETLQCLDRARLFLSIGEQYECNNYPIRSHPVADLYRAISNVRFLYLSDGAIEGFFHPCHDELNIELPKFPRLTDLEIGSMVTEEGLSLFTPFLQNSPQLASLSFGLCYSYGTWDPPTVVPFCMRYNLKVVKVNRFIGQTKVFSLVKYLLENANCLKELIFPGMKGYGAQAIMQVLMLPRASKSCKIVLT